MVQATDFMAEGAKFAELIMMLAAQRTEIFAQLLYGVAQALQFRLFGLCAIHGGCGDRCSYPYQAQAGYDEGGPGEALQFSVISLAAPARGPSGLLA